MKNCILVFLLISSCIHFVTGQSEVVVKKTDTGLTKLEFANNGNNILIGENSGSSISQGLRNVLIGNFNGLQIVNGSDNTLIGHGAGNLSAGTGNTALGYNAGQSSTGSGNIFIGNEAGLNAGSKDNTLWIHNIVADSSQVLIYGEMTNTPMLRFNASTDIYSSSSSNDGLFVKKTHSGNSDIPAIKGENRQTDYYGIGVQGHGNYIGVQGQAFGTQSGFYFGTSGLSLGSNTGVNYGLYGVARNAATNYSVYGESLGGPGNYAGYFMGKVHVMGTSADSLLLRVEDSDENSLLSVTDSEVIINNVREPVADQDAATKAYVDAATAGGGRMAVYDANGVKLGEVTAFESPGSSVSIMTSTGHLITLRLDGTIKNGQIYYSGANCSGNALLNGNGGVPIWAKTVVYSGSLGSLMVADGAVANGTVPMTEMTAQSIDNPDCGASSGIKDGWSIVPITAAAVGLPSYPFATPLAIY